LISSKIKELIKMKKPVNPTYNRNNKIPGLTGFYFSEMIRLLESESEPGERMKRFQSAWKNRFVPKLQDYIEQNLQTDEVGKERWGKYIDTYLTSEINLAKVFLEFLLKKNTIFVVGSALYDPNQLDIYKKRTNKELQDIKKELDIDSTTSSLKDALDKYISSSIEKKKGPLSKFDGQKSTLSNMFMRDIGQNYARYILEIKKSDIETIETVKSLIAEIFSSFSNLQTKKKVDLTFIEILFQYLSKKNLIFLVTSTSDIRRWEEYNKKEIEKITKESGIQEILPELERLFHTYAPRVLLLKNLSINNQQELDDLFKLFMMNVNENWLSYFEKAKEQKVKNLSKIANSIVLGSFRKIKNRQKSGEMVEPSVYSRKISNNGDVMGENKKFSYHKILREIKELEDQGDVYNKEEDHEYDMAKNQLKTAARAAKRIYKHVKNGEGELEAWVQSKITTAVEYLDTVADYLDSCCEEDEDDGEVYESRKIKESSVQNLRNIIQKSAQAKGQGSDTALRTLAGYREALTSLSGASQRTTNPAAYAKEIKDLERELSTLSVQTPAGTIRAFLTKLENLATRLNF
jgi:hypothetical protein